jgi:hypothetical protein
MGRIDDVVVHGEGQVLAHLGSTPTCSVTRRRRRLAGAIGTPNPSPGSARSTPPESSQRFLVKINDKH